LIVYVSLALTLTSYHTLQINRVYKVQRSEFHQDIITGEAKSPYQYRVVAPFLTEAGGLALEKLLGLSSEREAMLAREVFYSALRFIATLITLVAFHRYLMVWLSSEIAFGGTILLAGLHLYTFRQYFYQPSSFLYLMFLTVGTYLIVSGATAWLYPLIFVASLSRETSGILVAVYLAYNWPLTRNRIFNLLGLFATWLSAQVILRLAYENVESVLTRPLYYNFYYRNLFWPVFLFGIFWLVPLIGYRHLPPFLRRAILLVSPPLILVNFIWGKVEESRLFLELAIVLIPSTLFVLCEPESDATATPES
jgi:hypothetical protein